MLDPSQSALAIQRYHPGTALDALPAPIPRGRTQCQLNPDDMLTAVAEADQPAVHPNVARASSWIRPTVSLARHLVVPV